MPLADRDTWQRITADTAGVLSAAATASNDPAARRALIGAAQALHRATPGLDPGQPPAAAVDWPEPVRMTYPTGGATLGGVARVLMASRPRSGSGDDSARRLIARAAQLAVQVAQLLAGQQQASQAQLRAVEACAAARNATQIRTTSGWQFSKTGDQVIEAARQQAPDAHAAAQRTTGPAAGLER